MSRRIDIELTSSREDGTWTWRAAGARQPKGVLAGSILPADTKVGDVLRADIDSGLDGTEVLAVLPAKSRKEPSGERIELIGRTISDDQLVTTVLAKKGGGRGDRRDRRDRGDRRERRDGDRRDGDRRPRGEGERPGGERGDRQGRGRGEGGDRPDRPRRDRPAPPPRPKAKRLRAGRAHRKAALDQLAPEEQVIAEQLLRGGLPAVRQAVDKQNEAAKTEGRPLVKPDGVLAIAERLLPALRVAEWRDRAEAAVADLEDLDLRDLRSVIVAADSAAKDEETRELAEQLRAGLTRRVEAEQQKWLTELAETIDAGRVVRALRLSSRPPKAGAPLPSELASRLVEAASAALTADTFADRWSTVLDALSFSPIKAQVTPASKPETPSEELVAVITTFAGRLPHIAALFGIAPPPEAARKRSGRSGGRGRAKPGTKPSDTAGSPKAAPDAAEAEADTPVPATSEPSDTAAATETEPEGATGTPASAETPSEVVGSTTDAAHDQPESSPTVDGSDPVTEGSTDSGDQDSASQPD